MRYSFPHHASKKECVVPDPTKWKQLRIGMSYEEVTALLGDPINDPMRGGLPSEIEDSYFTYGWIDLPFTPHPRDYSFVIGFDEIGKLWMIQSPFGDAFSADGRPTSPEILLPLEGTEFGHYPRVLDVRWRPPAGLYPMHFEIQIGVGDPESQEFRDELLDSDLEGLYHCLSFVGAQPGRVRVRASNDIGVGPWSNYRYFEFTQ